MATSQGDQRLKGVIAAAGFASGDRIVIGSWDESPIGPFVDVMWAEADGWRTLFTQTEKAESFVCSIYHFDSLMVVEDLTVHRDPQRISAKWASVQLEWTLGRGIRFPRRTRFVAERIERPLARSILGVETQGMSPTGVIERYEAHRVRRITSGWAVVGGRDLGAIRAPTPMCGFGFSEPPPFPSITELTTHLHDPDGVIVLR
jgi:hypothetical protein